MDMEVSINEGDSPGTDTRVFCRRALPEMTLAWHGRVAPTGEGVEHAIIEPLITRATRRGPTGAFFAEANCQTGRRQGVDESPLHRRRPH